MKLIVKKAILNRRDIGKEKEDKAAIYLEKQGLRILERNFFTRHGEIDIIALEGNTLCFAEVKYRKNRISGYPEEAVTYSKMVKLCKSAEYYMYTHRQFSSCLIRFDVVALDDHEIRYYRNAFDYVGNLRNY